MKDDRHSTDNTEHHFRDLYYHLYSNSSSSRSERILADLSKLILVSISDHEEPMLSAVRSFITSNVAANKTLIPALKRCYPTAVNEQETFTLDDTSLRHALAVLSKIDLRSSPSHTFGDAFQALMGPRLRGDKGQFFTPRSVVRSIVDILNPVPSMHIIDPACGTGGFLSAVLDAWKGQSPTGSVTGVDKDSDLALLASALSSVHGPASNVNVYCANSLSIPDLQSNGISLGNYDVVVTNPPFGSKIGITDKKILAEYELGHIWDQAKKDSEWRQSPLIRSTQDPQILFLELCVRLLKEDGKLGIVLPEGVFGNTGSGYVWDYLRKNGTIDGLIDCPRTTFQPSTDTKTNILLFTKRASQQNSNHCFVAVAFSCGHDKRGRSQKANGDPVPDDFAAIALDWARPAHKRTVWSKAHLHNPYYLVPRYYDQHSADNVSADAAKVNAQVTTLGELVDGGLITIRKGHEVGSEAYGTGEVPFVRTSDIHHFEVSYDPTNSVSEDVYDSYSSQQNLKDGDIFMVVDGRYKIGRCAILHEWNKKCIAQSHLKIISLTKKAKFSPYALLYGLSLPSVQAEIRRLIFIQSTLGGLGKRIEEIRLPDPRSSHQWGETLSKFTQCIEERSNHAMYLRSFGNEVEL